MPIVDRTRRFALGAALLHGAIALAYLLHGVSIRHDFGPSTWDFFWQNLPTADLRDHALQSLWYLHAQPPLWNALNAPLIKLFGASHPEALQGLHFLMGSAMAGLAVLIAERLTGSLPAGVVAGLLVALDPALVLYEAYALYELSCAFLIMVGVWALVRAGPEGRTRPLLLAVAAISALVLTRSLYHVVVLAAAVVGAAALAQSRRVVFAAGIALALLPAAWYAKNLTQYGFFGASSWSGMGLWRVALFRFNTAELLPLLRSGALDPVVTVPPFSPPSEYRRFGYVGGSDVPSLSRDDFNNIDVPAISAAYGKSAKALIRFAPTHFLENAAIGYGNFSAPSTEYDHLAPDRERMRAHVAVYEALLLLPVARAIDRRLPIGTVGSVFALLIPLGVVAELLLCGRRVRRGEGLERVLREEAPLLAATALVVYTTLVGSALELGENVRFKFMIEPLLLTCWTVLVVRLRRHRAAERDGMSSAPPRPLASPPSPVEL